MKTKVKKEELTEERKEELLKLFDETANKLYKNWKRRKANKDIKISSSTIHDPIQLKMLAMSIKHDSLNPNKE